MSQQFADLESECQDPMVLWLAGPMKPIRINRIFADQTGLDREELESRSLFSWLHADDRAALQQCVRQGQGTVTARHRRRDGGWLPFEWQVRPHAGDVAILGRLQRPADAKARSEARVATAATIEATLDAMARIVEAKNPGLRCSILLVDSEGEYIVGGAGPSLPEAYNRAVEGLRIGPAVGSCGTAAFWNTPVVVEDIANDPLWSELREAAALAGVSACWSNPVTSMSGEVLGAMALYSDEPSVPNESQLDGLAIAARMVGLAIERDRLEDQLRQAAKLEAIGVLAGGLAHDFNNLLAVVQGNAELASESSQDAAVRPFLDEVLTATRTASDLCNQMLAYAGRRPRSVETVECNSLITELGALLKVALSKKASLVYDLQDRPAGASADRSQLRQVIMNLITNASEAIGDHDGRIVIGTRTQVLSRIELEAYSRSDLSPGEYVRVWVSDTGKGMDARTRAQIFDPFFTTKSSGRGLGLAVVQGIVRAHGGLVELDSTLGGGTTFSVLLPAAKVSGEETGASPAEPDSSGHDSPRHRILVVDDEPAVLRVLVKMLQLDGCDVVQASDGRQAIECFRREAESIDCVLLDLSMPSLGGEEVFGAIRAMRADVPVVLSSGFTEQEILNRFQGAGLDGVVQKPVRKASLLATIQAAIERKANS